MYPFLSLLYLLHCFSAQLLHTIFFLSFRQVHLVHLHASPGLWCYHTYWFSSPDGSVLGVNPRGLILPALSCLQPRERISLY